MLQFLHFICKQQKRFCAAFIALALAIQPECAFSEVLSNLPLANRLDRSDFASASVLFSSSQNVLPRVFVIEDAHGQIDAQMNIAATIEFLHRSYKISNLFLEGGLPEPISPDLLKFFKNDELNIRVAKQLLESGSIGGPELYRLQAKGALSVFGVEDPALYKKNLTLFKEVFAQLPHVLQFWNEVFLAIDRKASSSASAKLRAFLNLWFSYENKKSDLSLFLPELLRLAEEQHLLNSDMETEELHTSNLLRYMEIETRRREFAKTKSEGAMSAEQTQFREWLTRSGLRGRIRDVAGALLEVQDFNLQQFQISTRTALAYLFLKGSSFGFRFDDYPVLSRLWALQMLEEEMDVSKLTEEIDSLIALLMDRLPVNEFERRYVTVVKDLNLLITLSKLELTSHTFEDVLRRKDELRPAAFLKRLEDAGIRINRRMGLKAAGNVVEGFDLFFLKAVEFYEMAQKREEAIWENFLSRFQRMSEERAIIVLGGFHTEGIKKKLEAEKLPFAIFTPKMDRISKRDLYVRQIFNPDDSSAVRRFHLQQINPGRISSFEIEHVLEDPNAALGEEREILAAIATVLSLTSDQPDRVLASGAAFRLHGLSHLLNRKSELRLPTSANDALRLTDFFYRLNRLEGFLKRFEISPRVVSDGSVYYPTPFDLIPAIFDELSKVRGNLRGQHLFDFGAGDLRIAIAAHYLYGMKVTAFEKDKVLSTRAGQILKEARNAGFINDANFKWFGNQDGLKHTWKDMDVAYFFYTEPFGSRQARSFRKRLEEKLGEAKPDANMSILFTGQQLYQRRDDFRTMRVLGPGRRQLRAGREDLYLQIYGNRDSISTGDSPTPLQFEAAGQRAVRSELRTGTVKGQGALFWFDAHDFPHIVIDPQEFSAHKIPRRHAAQYGKKLEAALRNAYFNLTYEEQKSLIDTQRKNKIQRANGEWMELPLPIRLDEFMIEGAQVTPHEIILNAGMLRAPPEVLQTVLMHALKRSLNRFNPDLQIHDSEVFRQTLAFLSAHAAYLDKMQQWLQRSKFKSFFGRDWQKPLSNAVELTDLLRAWKGLYPSVASEIYGEQDPARAKRRIQEFLKFRSTQLGSVEIEVHRENYRLPTGAMTHVVYVKLGIDGLTQWIRLAPYSYRDWISTRDASLVSNSGPEIKMEFLWDVQNVADRVSILRKRYAKYPELLEVQDRINFGSEAEVAAGIELLKSWVKTQDLDLRLAARDVLYSVFKSNLNENVRTSLNSVVFDMVTERPSDFEPSRSNRVLSPDDTTARLHIQNVKERTRFRVRWAVNGGPVSVSESVSIDQNQSDLIWAVPVSQGWVHYQVEFSESESAHWKPYVLYHDQSDETSGLLKIQPHLEPLRMASVRPEVFNQRIRDGVPLVDDKGNIMVGTLDDLRRQLKSFKQNRGNEFNAIYLQVLETGAPGDAGPDPSPFSPLSPLRINSKIGGMEALLRLKEEADSLGILIFLDMIPHISRSNRTVSPETAAWIYDAGSGNLVRRAASDGIPPEWGDGFARNWTNPENVRAYIEDLKWLARLGFNFRIDVGHHFDTTFPPDASSLGPARTQGDVVTGEMEYRQVGGNWVHVYRTLDLRNTYQFHPGPNSVLGWIIYEVKKAGWDAGHQVYFSAENWHGHESKLVQSGVDYPYDPLIANMWDIAGRITANKQPAQRFYETLDYLRSSLASLGGRTLTTLRSHDEHVPPADAFGSAAFSASAAIMFAVSGGSLEHLHNSFLTSTGEIDWIRTLAEHWQIPVNRFGPARVVNGVYWPAYDWWGKRAATDASLYPFLADLGGFIGRILAIVRRSSKQIPIALNVGHDRVIGMARKVRENEFFIFLSHMGSPYAADINFHPNDKWQRTNRAPDWHGMGEFDPDSVYELQEVLNNEKPDVTIRKPGKVIRFTGREITHLGIGPHQPLPILGTRIYRFVRRSQSLPHKNTAAYRNLLRDSIVRYKKYGPHDRFQHSFVAREVVKSIDASNKDAYSFYDLFRLLSSIVDDDSELRVGDLTSLFHDLTLYYPSLNGRLYKLLIHIAVKVSESSRQAEPLVSHTAIRVLRSTDIGEVVLTSPESLWSAGTGGLALYITDQAKQLAALGIPVSVVVPLFANQKGRIFTKFNPRDTGRTISVKFGADGEETAVAKIYEAYVDGVRVLYLENDRYFGRLSGPPETGESAYNGSDAFRLRFSRFLSLGTLLAIREMNIHASVIHTNEWSTAYVKAYLEGRERIDGNAKALRSDPHLKETKVLSIGHNLHRNYHGRVTVPNREVRDEMIRHDLGMSPELDWDILVNQGEWEVINPTYTAIKTSDQFRTVSTGYHDRSLDMAYNDEFGGLVSLLQWKNQIGAYDGMANGFDLVGRQRSFFRHMFRSERVRSAILRALNAGTMPVEISTLRSVLEEWLFRSESVKSLQEIGHDEMRRLLSYIVVHFIHPVQKEDLQRAFGLDTEKQHFVYAMLHRIGEQKGHQLLFAPIWSQNNPDGLQVAGGFFEFSNYWHPLGQHERERLLDYARNHGRPTLRAVEVFMVLHPESQFIIAGSAEPNSAYDHEFADIASKFPDQFRYANYFITQDDPRYELIYSGADRFGMPSWFEPGGLSNQEAASYGVPRHLSGRDGLVDSEIRIESFREAFEGFNPVFWFGSLENHLKWMEHPAGEEELRYQALIQDNRWLNRTKNYVELYRRMVDKPEIKDFLTLEVASAINRARRMLRYSDPADELVIAGYDPMQAVQLLIQSLVYSSNQELVDWLINDHIPFLGKVNDQVYGTLRMRLREMLERHDLSAIHPRFERALVRLSATRSELRVATAIEGPDVFWDHIFRPFLNSVFEVSALASDRLPNNPEAHLREFFDFGYSRTIPKGRANELLDTALTRWMNHTTTTRFPSALTFSQFDPVLVEQLRQRMTDVKMQSLGDAFFPVRSEFAVNFLQLPNTFDLGDLQSIMKEVSPMFARNKLKLLVFISGETMQNDMRKALYELYDRRLFLLKSTAAFNETVESLLQKGSLPEDQQWANRFMARAKELAPGGGFSSMIDRFRNAQVVMPGFGVSSEPSRVARRFLRSHTVASRVSLHEEFKTNLIMSLVTSGKTDAAALLKEFSDLLTLRILNEDETEVELSFNADRIDDILAFLQLFETGQRELARAA